VAFDVVIVLGFGVGIPVACGIAILKHGLYEIDVVINRTVVYGLLAAFFTVVYVGIVVGIGTAVGSRSNTFLTILAAVVIAVAFQPLRERARRVANRMVYGERATPYEVLSEFAERMAGAYATEDILPRMARILGEGTGAAGADVWLRVGTQLRPAARWPASGDGAPRRPPLTVTDDEFPNIPGVGAAMPVRHHGELLGALSVTKPPAEPLTPAEQKLVSDLAAQAGLVLRNVRLTEELKANLNELRASRQRIVTAQDQERRRLERNIHDGAQQQLVSIAVKLRLVEALIARDPERAAEMARQVGAETTDALETLRDLARGIYPPLLVDGGLGAALSAQARKVSLPVSVEIDGLERYPQEVEGAIYFCVLEALQNVAKYAEASRAIVRLEAHDGHLSFTVTDEGVGFDPTRTSFGTGLQGMEDRLSALGGELSIRSEPGTGTTVTGVVPVRMVQALA
jgi:signal transduction histidine kinase